ncbi:unnamed protein product [Ectocarpus sp. 4 AP-2014]
MLLPAPRLFSTGTTTSTMELSSGTYREKRWESNTRNIGRRVAHGGVLRFFVGCFAVYRAYSVRHRHRVCGVFQFLGKGRGSILCFVGGTRAACCPDSRNGVGRGGRAPV